MIVVVEKILIERTSDQNMVKKKDNFSQEILNSGKSFLKFFIGYLIKRGGKHYAYYLFRFLVKNLKDNLLKPYFFLEYAIFKIKPLMGLKDYYSGKTKYRVPYFIFTLSSIKLGSRWIINSAKNRGENLLKIRLLYEILELLDQRSYKSNNTKLRRGRHYKAILDNRPFLKHVRKKFR